MYRYIHIFIMSNHGYDVMYPDIMETLGNPNRVDAMAGLL